MCVRAQVEAREQPGCFSPGVLHLCFEAEFLLCPKPAGQSMVFGSLVPGLCLCLLPVQPWDYRYVPVHCVCVYVCMCMYVCVLSVCVSWNTGPCVC